MKRWLAMAGAVALAACSQDGETSADANAAAGVDNGVAEAVEANAATPENAVTAEVPAPAASSELRAWLVGRWSYDPNCENDIMVHYGADDKIDDSGETGTWSIAGDTVTKTVTERYEFGDEGTTKVNPPEVVTYKVERVDADHGIIFYDGNRIPILRCG